LRGVFSEIAGSAARLCDAYAVVICQVDGEPLLLSPTMGHIPWPARCGGSIRSLPLHPQPMASAYRSEPLNISAGKWLMQCGKAVTL